MLLRWKPSFIFGVTPAELSELQELSFPKVFYWSFFFFRFIVVVRLERFVLRQFIFRLYFFIYFAVQSLPISPALKMSSRSDIPCSAKVLRSGVGSYDFVRIPV
jgi:hypothetical protein